jgi:hypothetical protein
MKQALNKALIEIKCINPLKHIVFYLIYSEHWPSMKKLFVIISVLPFPEQCISFQ